MTLKLSEMSARKRAALIGAGLCVLAVAVLATYFGVDVRYKYADRMHELDAAPEAVYGVILGASVDPETGRPNIALQDRLDTAVDLLKARKIMGVIVTGDDGLWKSNERKAMLDYLREQKVPEDIIFVDNGAYRTFDSCRNLKASGFTDVVLITQRFHLPRALYLCNQLGVRADGVVADRRWYGESLYYWVRDIAASPFAYFDVRGVTIIEKGPGV